MRLHLPAGGVTVCVGARECAGARISARVSPGERYTRAGSRPRAENGSRKNLIGATRSIGRISDGAMGAAVGAGATGGFGPIY